MTLAAGQTLRDYRILGSLGHGGMGEVYRALDLRLRREVALKVLPEHLADDDRTLSRFEREARTLASLSHPNIAAIFGIDQVEDVCFLVLELVPGEDLARRLERGPLPIAEALEIAHQIAEGLAAAHAAGVVHRDVKPANVVVTPGGRAKVLDFGLAKRVELAATIRASTEDSLAGLTVEGTILGTVDYMSPEQCRGRDLDERADCWAFGCLFFELLTGVRIFSTDSVTATLAAIVADEPDWDLLPKGTPAHVRALLRQCLEKEAIRRPTSMAQVVELLTGGASVRVPTGTASIAVLPFASSDPGGEYFSDGVTDEIQSALSGLPGLRVAARTSSFSFRGSSADATEIGSKLRVTHLLEGSVRRSGDRVRISVQLIDTSEGHQQWAQRFDGEMRDIFELQDEVASQVASAMRVELLAGEGTRIVQRVTSDMEAYDLYLQGRFFLQQRGTALEQAARSFRAALERDPDLAAAHAGLAEAYGLLGYYGSRRPAELMPLAREAARRAIELDPSLAEAHTALGWVHFIYDWDDTATERELRAALRLDPRAIQARLWYGAYILVLKKQQHDEGIALCREAAELDPLSGSAHGQLSVAYNLAGRTEEAIATAERQLELHSGSYLLWFQYGLSLSNLGEHARARDVLERAVSLGAMNAWAMGMLGAQHAILGDVQRAESIHAQLAGSGWVSPICMAMTPAALGRLDEAFELLERAVDERDGLVRVLSGLGVLDPVRRDPRCAELLQRVGLG